MTCMHHESLCVWCVCVVGTRAHLCVKKYMCMGLQDVPHPLRYWYLSCHHHRLHLWNQNCIHVPVRKNFHLSKFEYVYEVCINIIVMHQY